MSLLFELRNLLTIHSVLPVAKVAPATPAPAVAGTVYDADAALCSPPYTYKTMRFSAASTRRPESRSDDGVRRGVPTQWSSQVSALADADKESLYQYLG